MNDIKLHLFSLFIYIQIFKKCGSELLFFSLVDTENKDIYPNEWFNEARYNKNLLYLLTFPNREKNIKDNEIGPSFVFCFERPFLRRFIFNVIYIYNVHWKT